MTSETINRNAVTKFWRTTAIFVVLWSALICVMIALPLYLKGHRSNEDMQIIVFICAFGGAVAALITRLFSRFFTWQRVKSARFAATLVLLSSTSVLSTAFLFSLQYRIYFAQWHQSTFSVGWFFQFVFTGAYSVYLYASTALHLLVSPMNVVILILCAWIFEPRR